MKPDGTDPRYMTLLNNTSKEIHGKKSSQSENYSPAFPRSEIPKAVSEMDIVRRDHHMVAALQKCTARVEDNWGEVSKITDKNISSHGTKPSHREKG